MARTIKPRTTWQLQADQYNLSNLAASTDNPRLARLARGLLADIHREQGRPAPIVRR